MLLKLFTVNTWPYWVNTLLFFVIFLNEITSICCLFKAVLPNKKLSNVHLGLHKDITDTNSGTTKDTNSFPWSVCLVIPKRSIWTLISSPRIKYWFAELCTCLVLPCSSSALCGLSSPHPDVPHGMLRACQGLMMFQDGAANSYVFFPTLGSHCPGAFRMAAGTMSETKRCEQGFQWGLQAGLSRGWNEAFLNVSQLPEWCSSTEKALSSLSPPQHCAVQYKPAVGYIWHVTELGTAEICHGPAQLYSTCSVCSGSLRVSTAALWPHSQPQPIQGISSADLFLNVFCLLN